MKKTPLRSRSAPLRSREPARGGGIPRKTRIKASNAKRRMSEFARCYHSRERVRFVKGLPCFYCNALSPFLGDATRGRCDNAHVETDGAGRKASYDKIVPLCRSHHAWYDEHRAPFDRPEVREAFKPLARVTEELWQSHLRQTGRARSEETDGNA